ncbi:MAG TPA: amino acid permease [Bacteroidales bacterium]|nr:amino acid permease [Bacteroidales bacterium]
MESIKLISPSRAIAIVVSNMIGTGVYTSLCYQALDIKSTFALLFIWITGGVVALCGALTYGELAARIPRSGGEYTFLSELFHPSFGFLSGFISITIGFAAPMALLSMYLGKYSSNFIPVSPELISIGLISILLLINLSSFRLGTNFNFATTIINILLIMAFVVFGLYNGPHNGFSFTVNSTSIKEVISPAFAVSLVYVSFAYSGWNSAAYITHQIKDPVKNLPKILIFGTLIVITLYTLLNFIFIYSTPLSDIVSKGEDFAFICSQNIFGNTGSIFVALLISIGLIASVNSLLIIGPRVTQAITLDYPSVKKLGVENKHGVPYLATILLAVISLILFWTQTFKEIVTMIGFTLGIFTISSVIGIFILRHRLKKNGAKIYHTFGYPLIPILFIVIEGCMMIFVLIKETKPSLTGIAITLSGFIFYYILIKLKKHAN